MSDAHFTARYRIEALPPFAEVADLMAGARPSGIFARAAGETDELRQRTLALVVEIHDIGEVAPILADALACFGGKS